MGRVVILSISTVEDELGGFRLVARVEDTIQAPTDEARASIIAHVAETVARADDIINFDIQTSDIAPDLGEDVTFIGLIHQSDAAQVDDVEALLRGSISRLLDSIQSTDAEAILRGTAPYEDSVTQGDDQSLQGRITKTDELSEQDTPPRLTGSVRGSLDSIQVLETLVRRGSFFVLDSVPPVSDPPVQLLGRLFASELLDIHDPLAIVDDGVTSFIFLRAGTDVIQVSVEAYVLAGTITQQATVEVADAEQDTFTIKFPTEAIQALQEQLLQQGRLFLLDALPQPQDASVTSGRSVTSDELQAILTSLFTSLSAFLTDALVSPTEALKAGFTQDTSIPLTPEIAQILGRFVDADAVQGLAEAQESVLDVFQAQSLTGDGEVGSTEAMDIHQPPNGALEEIKETSDAGSDSYASVGHWPRNANAPLPNTNLQEILYYFMIPGTLSDDIVEVLHDLDLPVYNKNPYFAADLSDWSTVDISGTSTDIFHHSTDGFQDMGCVRVQNTASATNTGTTELRQRVTSLPTDAGRTVRIEIAHKRIGSTAGTVTCLLKEDNAGSPGSTIHSFTLSVSDTSWTTYVREGNEAGTLDFTINDSVSTVWLVVQAVDNSIVNTLSRRLDTFRLLVDTGESNPTAVVAKTYPTDGQKPNHLYLETFEVYTSGDPIDDWGWTISTNSPEITTTVASDAAAAGAQSLKMANTGTVSGTEVVTKPFTGGRPSGCCVVRHRRRETTTSTTKTRLNAGANDVSVDFEADSDIVVTEPGGTHVLGTFVADQWYSIVFIWNGKAMTVIVGSGTDPSTMTIIGRTSFPFSTTVTDLELEGTLADEHIAWWDEILWNNPLVVDVSSSNLSITDAENLRARIRHVITSSIDTQVLVDAIGLRYAIAS